MVVAVVVGRLEVVGTGPADLAAVAAAVVADDGAAWIPTFDLGVGSGRLRSGPRRACCHPDPLLVFLVEDWEKD